MTSQSEENYLKAIFSLNESAPNSASTNAIAKRLSTRAASVSDMLKKLSDKELIHYQKYQAAELTESGRQVAISIIRKHRLWEFFLVNKLNFGWDEVHDIAEQLEHIQSKKLTNELEKFLGYPELDPHGDPIPNQAGEFPIKLEKTLANSAEKETTQVLGVKDDSVEFLGQLGHLGIQLGTLIEVLRINPFDESLEISFDGKNCNISSTIAKNLFIKTVES